MGFHKPLNKSTFDVPIISNQPNALIFPYHPWDWYIYLHLPQQSTIHIGKYTNPMDGMGLVSLFLSSPMKTPAVSGGGYVDLH